MSPVSSPTESSSSVVGWLRSRMTTLSIRCGELSSGISSKRTLYQPAESSIVASDLYGTQLLSMAPSRIRCTIGPSIVGAGLAVV